MTARVRRVAALYHCPFCAEEDLRPVSIPEGAWSCGACARVFTVDLLRITAADLPRTGAGPDRSARPLHTPPLMRHAQEET